MALQTLHRMYIVNAGPGFKKMLWPAAQKFLDAKTIGKINVKDIALGILLFIPLLLLPSWLSLLFINCRFWSPNLWLGYWRSLMLGLLIISVHSYLEFNLWSLLSPCFFLTSFSQLPDFLGGSCTCSMDRGCLRSNKGPWNDPAIMKVAIPSIKVVLFI